MRTKELLVSGFMLFFSAITFAQSTSLFEKGNELYKAEEYHEAVTTWTKILEDGEHSAALYFNLGNAHYKLNDIAPSIYYYEKALQLAPNDEDIKNNLQFAQNARIDVIEPLPKSVFAKWNASVEGLFTYDQWALTAVSALALFVLLFLVYYFSYAEKRKRLFFVGSMGAVLIAVIAVVMAYNTFGAIEKDMPAIVFSESAEVKSEPNLRSDAAFTLHEGTKVQILDTDSDWVKIELADGKDGWIPATDLKVL